MSGPRKTSTWHWRGIHWRRPIGAGVLLVSGAVMVLSLVRPFHPPVFAFIPEAVRDLGYLVALGVTWPAWAVSWAMHEAGIRNDALLWTFASCATLGFWILIAALDQFPFMRPRPNQAALGPSEQHKS